MVLIVIDSLWVVSIRLTLTPSWYLSPFSRYFTLKLFPIAAMVNINSISGLADTRLSDFHQTNSNHISRDSTLVTLVLKIGKKIAICRAFNSFHVTDRQAD